MQIEKKETNQVVIPGAEGNRRSSRYSFYRHPEFISGSSRFNGKDKMLKQVQHDGVRASGFTLIELLVVVLIIGILAAIAVPQYQKAVEKSKSAQAVTLLKSVYQAAEEYYLANGTWPTSVSDLSVAPPWTGTTRWYSEVRNPHANDEWSLGTIVENSNNSFGLTIGRIAGKHKGGGFAIWHKYTYSTNMPIDTIVCAEKIEEIETAGDYCQKVMQSGNLIFTGSRLRYYKMP